MSRASTKPRLRVRVANSAGFCFGVKRALRLAADTCAGGARVSMLGEIVHNEDVLREIKEWGVHHIRRPEPGAHGRLLLISAHGLPLRVMERARRHGYALVDATCPMVKHIHRRARALEREGRRVIVIGDPRHDEVKGIVGQLRRRPLVVNDTVDPDDERLRGLRRAGVVVQSTHDRQRVLAIVASLADRISDLKFENTICRPTTVKQEEVRTLAGENDVMVIIGSQTSANTRRLYEISMSKNRRTHWIRAARDLRPRWFQGARWVGVSAGASTPDSVTRSVIDTLRRLPRAAGQGT